MAGHLTLMSDYHAPWPLWTDGGCVDDPRNHGVSPGLAADLHAWDQLFQDDFHWDTGWRTGDAEERYARGSVELLHRLRAELGPGTEVALDLWPVQAAALRAWVAHRRRAAD